MASNAPAWNPRLHATSGINHPGDGLRARVVGAEANAPIELRPEAANWLAGPVSPAKADLRGTQDPPEEPSWHWLSTVARSE